MNLHLGGGGNCNWASHPPGEAHGFKGTVWNLHVFPTKKTWWVTNVGIGSRRDGFFQKIYSFDFSSWRFNLQLYKEIPNAKFDQALQSVIGPVFQNQPNTWCIKHDVGTGSNITSQKDKSTKQLWFSTDKRSSLYSRETPVEHNNEMMNICDLESEHRGRCPANIECIGQHISQSVVITTIWYATIAAQHPLSKRKQKGYKGKRWENQLLPASSKSSFDRNN